VGTVGISCTATVGECAIVMIGSAINSKNCIVTCKRSKARSVMNLPSLDEDS
jgi:hypothetical protein